MYKTVCVKQKIISCGRKIMKKIFLPVMKVLAVTNLLSGMCVTCCYSDTVIFGPGCLFDSGIISM